MSYVCPPTSVVCLRLKQTLATVPLYTGSSKQEIELFKQEMELFKQEMEIISISCLLLPVYNDTVAVVGFSLKETTEVGGHTYIIADHLDRST